MTNSIEELINTNMLSGKLRKTKKGFLVYEESIYMREDEAYSLKDSLFLREGYSLKGWRARYKGINNLNKWYCIDGSWKTKEEIRSNQSSDLRKVFERSEKVVFENLKFEGTIVFEALWQI